MRNSKKRAGWDSLDSKQSYQVRKTLNKYRKNHPVCELTGSNKKVQVHHIIPIWERPDLADDPENLISLSTAANIHLIYGHNGNFGRRYVHNISEIKNKFKEINNSLEITHRPITRSKKISFWNKIFNKNKDIELAYGLMQHFLSYFKNSENNKVFLFNKYEKCIYITSQYLEMIGRISLYGNYIDFENKTLDLKSYDFQHDDFIKDSIEISIRILENLEVLTKNKIKFIKIVMINDKNNNKIKNLYNNYSRQISLINHFIKQAKDLKESYESDPKKTKKKIKKIINKYYQ